MFRLPDSWVWDFWLAKDQDTYHLFFLYASRALHDPDRTAAFGRDRCSVGTKSRPRDREDGKGECHGRQCHGRSSARRQDDADAHRHECQPDDGQGGADARLRELQAVYENTSTAVERQQRAGSNSREKQDISGYRTISKQSLPLFANGVRDDHTVVALPNRPCTRRWIACRLIGR